MIQFDALKTPASCFLEGNTEEGSKKALGDENKDFTIHRRADVQDSFKKNLILKCVMVMAKH